ncbi:unnamed protein product [Adineta steineri]|uniref:Uncharacterized protein n=1 Tax=Adineta steineri TaxID=433720 RepID=A0A813TKC9_9BILA|nr:unnamed protein product [Adineta steineri]
MSCDTTENDALIARLLSEDDDFESNSFIPSKKFKTDHVQQTVNNSSSTERTDISTQFQEDSEMAYILQIEEIVLSENKINAKTIEVTDAQLEKTHAGITNALQSTESTDNMTKIFGMFTAIQTRYTDCQAKNQDLIDKIQKISVALYPTLISLKLRGNTGGLKPTPAILAIGLITNVLQGKIDLNEAKQLVSNLLQMWNDSNVWYEFCEQLVYILVAITIPAFAQRAMGKIMEKISSSK